MMYIHFPDIYIYQIYTYLILIIWNLADIYYLISLSEIELAGNFR